MIKKSITLSSILSCITIIAITIVNVVSLKIFNTMPFSTVEIGGADCIEYIGPLMDVTMVCSTSPGLSSSLHIEYHPIAVLITFLVLLPIYFGIAMLIYKALAKKEQRTLNNEQ